MLRDGDRLWLTPRDKRRWRRITGIEPAGIHTVGNLRRYVAACKRQFGGTCEDSHYLRWMIDAEFERCTGIEDVCRQEDQLRPQAPAADGPLKSLPGRREDLERELLELIVFGGKEAHGRVAELADQLRPRGKLSVVRPEPED